jgi:cysteinyl-tRNA synthetase
MSTRYLGEQFDIHCGGVDHIPVHHTNEIAQTEAATGKKWVNYWIHGEFLILDDGKMAKSKGKFITLQSLMDEGYEPLDYRYFNLNAHYRTQLQFTFESLAGARSARGRLMDRVADIMDAADEPTRAEVELLADSGTERLDRDFRSAADHVAAFREHLSEDLNAPRCLADLWGLVKDETVSPRDALLALVDIDRVLGIRIIREGGARLRSRKPERLEQELLDLIEKREEARKNRNFQTADQIRDMLKGRGIIVEDSADGPKWRKL